MAIISNEDASFLRDSGFVQQGQLTRTFCYAALRKIPVIGDVRQHMEKMMGSFGILNNKNKKDYERLTEESRNKRINGLILALEHDTNHSKDKKFIPTRRSKYEHKHMLMFMRNQMVKVNNYTQLILMGLVMMAPLV